MVVFLPFCLQSRKREREAFNVCCLHSSRSNSTLKGCLCRPTRNLHQGQSHRNEHEHMPCIRQLSKQRLAITAGSLFLRDFDFSLCRRIYGFDHLVCICMYLFITYLRRYTIIVSCIILRVLRFAPHPSGTFK